MEAASSAAASVDLAPVLDALVEIQAYQAATIGVILGGIVILVLAVMFR